MDGKQENQILAVVNESNVNGKSQEVSEEPAVVAAAALLSTSNADEENDVSASPASGKLVKKKTKTKARNSVAGNDLDTELKKLSQRRINVAGAPKMPLNAYVRFMNDRREELRRELPQRTALEHTKIIGEEWHQLTEDRRTPYMEAAAKDKALYQEQMHKFLKEHPEILANELAKVKKVFDSKIPKDKTTTNSTNIDVVPKKSNAKMPVTKQQSAPTPDPDDIPLAQVKRTPTPPPPPPSQPPSFSACASVIPRQFAAGEIPIYTNEFIEHNRSTENELRMLRKTKTDLEQQNSVLEQHVDNTKAGHAKVMGEVTELKEENARLNAYIKGLRQKVVKALEGVTLPPLDPNGLSVKNVDTYIQHLASMISSSSVGGQQNNAMLMQVGDVLGKMDTSGLQKP
ncbi:high mobility group protein 20A [Drosophila innubila]|uniref:high mobility group protein 20A n=1 Tax=Drosophila innubila TaxID=198719 RepID=UPI00148E62E4|nr:high mobility group protein 20A [Drosophila innubila]